MLKINRRTDYAVRVMVALAKRPEGSRLSTQDVQSEMVVPHAFLQRIVADLSKAHLIQTYPGPNGGLQLSRSKDSINLRNIYEAIEGNLLISDCLEGAGVCSLDGGCPVRPHWSILQCMIVRELEGISLEQLSIEAEKIRRKQPITSHSNQTNSTCL